MTKPLLSSLRQFTSPFTNAKLSSNDKARNKAAKSRAKMVSNPSLHEVNNKMLHSSEVEACLTQNYIIGKIVALRSYSLFQNKRTFNSEFFVASPRGATKKFEIKCAFLLTQTV